MRQPFSATSAFFTADRNPAQVSCSHCGMMLMIPGLERWGRSYCSTACLRARPTGRIDAVTDAQRLEVVRAVRVGAEPETVAAFLAKPELLPLFEEKLDRVQVLSLASDRTSARARADGHIRFLRYQFEVLFSAIGSGGFESSESTTSWAAFDGAFMVRPHPRGTVVTHIERFRFRVPQIGRWFGGPIKHYVGRSIERELRRLKVLIERPGMLAEALRMSPQQRIRPDPAIVVWDPKSRVRAISIATP